MFGSISFKGVLRSWNSRSYGTTAAKDLINFTLGRQNTFISASSLFFNSKLQSFNPHWHTKGRVPTTFMAKRNLIAIHAWMIHVQLMKQGDYGRVLDEALFDMMWEDATNWVRGLPGVMEMTLTKHLTTVQKENFNCCLELDDAISYDPDEDEVLLRIGDVVWRYIYNEAKDVDEHIEAFAKYIRTEQLSLLSMNPQAVIDGRINFSPLPSFPALQLTPEEEEIEKQRENHIKQYGDWYEDRSLAGKPYFWNSHTGVSLWTKPKPDEEKPV